jgi:hypothetical protein
MVCFGQVVEIGQAAGFWVQQSFKRRLSRESELPLLAGSSLMAPLFQSPLSLQDGRRTVEKVSWQDGENLATGPLIDS